MRIIVRKIIALLILVFVFSALVQFFVERGTQASFAVLALATAVAVISSYFVWPLSLIAVLATMLVVSIVFPVAIFYAMGKGAGIEDTISVITSNIEWPLFLSPLVVSIPVWFVIKRITTRWKNVRQIPQ